VYGRRMIEKAGEAAGEVRRDSVRNIGIVAHVDAGKTTTTEQFLFIAGRLRKVGRVDDGTAFSDWLEVERKRGISVRATALKLTWRDGAINLIDTPGHVDFSAEVERALGVLDGAVLVVSAGDGIEAHTEALWHALRSMHVPTLLYVNKIDRLGTDLDQILQDCRSLLTPNLVAMQRVEGQGTPHPVVVDGLNDQNPQMLETLFEQLADYDDGILERFLQQAAPDAAQLRSEVARLVRECRVLPVLFGASLKGIGVGHLLNAIVDWLPEAPRPVDEPLSGVVFKVERHPRNGRGVYVRLYSGRLHTRDALVLGPDRTTEKVSQIRQLHGQQQVDSGLLEAGDIAAIYGLSHAHVGDVFGDPRALPQRVGLAESVLSVDVTPGPEEDFTRLAEALTELDDEDPQLSFEWLAETRECQVRVLGKVQIEILGDLLQSRYGLHPTFGAPKVLYRETPSGAGEGFVSYTMPKPCWAVLRFAIKPGARGSGLRYTSQAHPDRLLPRYQHEVARRVPEALSQGLWGWPVTDLEVVLVDGEHHVWHTHPLDFVVATPMGIMDALVNTGTVLLEPILGFRLSAPEEAGGKIMSDLIKRRAVFDPPWVRGNQLTLDGEVPLATVLDYGMELSRLTGGRGNWATRFAAYRQAPESVSEVRPRRGVDPRDRAKYILAVRQALRNE
jgi:small GTP-binding protein